MLPAPAAPRLLPDPRRPLGGSTGTDAWARAGAGMAGARAEQAAGPGGGGGCPRVGGPSGVAPPGGAPGEGEVRRAVPWKWIFYGRLKLVLHREPCQSAARWCAAAPGIALLSVPGTKRSDFERVSLCPPPGNAATVISCPVLGYKPESAQGWCGHGKPPGALPGEVPGSAPGQCQPVSRRSRKQLACRKAPGSCGRC